MHLTESQLDAAARKLIDVWLGPGEHAAKCFDSARRCVHDCLTAYPETVAAIIHAVTSETCNWQWDDEFDIWRLECDEVLQKFVIDADEMEFRFCPYCGKTIAFVSQQKDEVSE